MEATVILWVGFETRLRSPSFHVLEFFSTVQDNRLQGPINASAGGSRGGDHAIHKNSIQELQGLDHHFNKEKNTHSDSILAAEGSPFCRQSVLDVCQQEVLMPTCTHHTMPEYTEMSREWLAIGMINIKPTSPITVPREW